MMRWFASRVKSERTDPKSHSGELGVSTRRRTEDGRGVAARVAIRSIWYRNWVKAASNCEHRRTQGQKRGIRFEN
jgi:hypothetical protein